MSIHRVSVSQSCGCKIDRLDEEFNCQWHWCPLHAAAPALREMLEECVAFYDVLARTQPPPTSAHCAQIARRAHTALAPKQVVP